MSTKKAQIIRELDHVPESYHEEILDFVRFVEYKSNNASMQLASKDSKGRAVSSRPTSNQALNDFNERGAPVTILHKYRGAVQGLPQDPVTYQRNLRDAW